MLIAYVLIVQMQHTRTYYDFQIVTNCLAFLLDRTIVLITISVQTYLAADEGKCMSHVVNDQLLLLEKQSLPQPRVI